MKRYDFSILSFTGESCLIPGIDFYNEALFADSKRTPELIYLKEKAAFLEAQENYQAQKVAADGLLIDWAKSKMTLSYTRLKAIERTSQIRPLFLALLRESETDQDFLTYWESLASHRWLHSDKPIKEKLLPAISAPAAAISEPAAPAAVVTAPAAPIAPARKLKDLTIDCRTDAPLAKCLYAFEGETTHEMFFADLGLNEKEFHLLLQLLTNRPELRIIPSNKEDKAERDNKLRYLETINGVLASYLDISEDCFTIKHGAKTIACNIGKIIPAFWIENLPTDTNVEDDGKCDLEAKYKYAKKAYNDEQNTLDLMGAL
jgi:hypothetical protein